MLHRSEEAGIVRGELQNCVAADRSSNDELIPRFDLPGDCAEAQASDDVAGGSHQTAQRRPGHELMSKTARRELAPADCDITWAALPNLLHRSGRLDRHGSSAARIARGTDGSEVLAPNTSASFRARFSPADCKASIHTPT